jgi:Matrixin
MVLSAVYIPRLHSAATLGQVDHASTAAAGPGYSFEHKNPNGAPVRWNPCAPIKYETNFAAAPSYVPTEFETALAKLEAATGLRFVDEGTSSAFSPSGARATGPVLVVWASPEQTAQLKEIPNVPFGLQEAGRASVREDVDGISGHGQYVNAEVVFDADASRLPGGFGPGSVGVLFLHELGHLVGLGHVTNSAEIMNPVIVKTKTAEYGPGDLAGLRRLGMASGCLAAPPKGAFSRGT